MKKILLCIIICFRIYVASAMEEHKTATTVTSGLEQFSKQFYQAMAKKNGNVFCSPFSVHTVLAMSYLGTGGSTYEAFQNTLHAPEAEQTAEEYKHVITSLNNVQNVTLLTANKVYVMEGHQLAPKFQKGISEQYLSEIESVNFADNANTVKSINQWVEEKTKDKIKDLLKINDVDSDTRLVLVNAIYFKGNWLYKFDKALTKTESFFFDNQNTVDVQMMHITKNFNYKEDSELDAQILRLPYTDSSVSMIILLPNKRNGINELEKKMANFEFHKIMQRLWEFDVTLTLPKFKLEETIDLQASLTELGLGEIFSGSANFSRMFTTPTNLCVTKAIQKAFVEVNEEGAEAAAATALVYGWRSGKLELPKVEMKVDHPFIFQIIKHDPLMILFQGRVTFKPAV